jgi:uncharacterized delta-60 repeat protein
MRKQFGNVGIILMTILLGFFINACQSDDSDGVSVVYNPDAPTIVQMVPSDASTDVPINTSISITFNKAIVSSTVTSNTSDSVCSGSVQLSNDSFVTCVQATSNPVASNGDTTYTVIPASSLSENTNYKVKLTTAITSSDGSSLSIDLITNFSVTTGTGVTAVTEVIAPTVSNCTYFECEDDNCFSSVVFSETMDSSTITTNTADNSCSGSLQISADDFSTCFQMKSSPVDKGSNKFAINPINLPAVSTEVKFKVTTAVKDLVGNAMAEEYLALSGYMTVQTSSLGVRDSSFGTNGLVVKDFASDLDRGRDITVADDGNILVLANVNLNSSDDLKIWKLTTSGLEDASFGTNSIDQISTTIIEGSSFAVGANGNIYVAGTVDPSGPGRVWAVLPTGTPDTSFNGSGDYTTTATKLNDITVLPSGEILAVGYRFFSDNDLILLKINSNGSLDSSFTGGGEVNFDSGGVDDVGNKVLVDDAGKILVVGSSGNLSGMDMALWRFNPDGSLDTSFAGDGSTTHDVGAFADIGNAIAIDSDGNIFVTGSGIASSYNDMIIWKYSTAGVLDTTFGTNGIVQYDLANDHDHGYDIAIDGQGKILVVGYSYNDSNINVLEIWRYNSNGTADTSFGTNGVITEPGSDLGSNPHSYGYAIKLMRNGNILVTGTDIQDVVVLKYK